MIEELSLLFRPYAEMYMFHILDSYLMGKPASKKFVSVAIALFLIGMFYSEANRSGDRLYARLVFVAIIGGLVYYDTYHRPEITKSSDPGRSSSG